MYVLGFERLTNIKVIQYTMYFYTSSASIIAVKRASSYYFHQPQIVQANMAT